MKDFVNNSSNLKIRNISRSNALVSDSPIKQIEAAIAQNKDVGDECSTKYSLLSSYLDDIESTMNLIFDGIESKIEFMVNYCDAITSNANQIPYNKFGYIHTYTTDIKLEGMSYIKGKGLVLGAN